jgi:predicted nucleic acid-binding Zn ribbon protein
MELARNTLQKIMADTLKRLPAEQVPLAAWEFAAGKTVAEKTRALGFADGVLSIEVPDATWRSQLSSMTNQFLSQLNQYSSQRIERLEFVIAGKNR